MSIYARPSTTFEARTPPFPSGLIGTLGAKVMNGQGVTSVARSTGGIVEEVINASWSTYVATLTAPAATGEYGVIFDDTSDLTVGCVEDLLITERTLLEGPTSGQFATLADIEARLGRELTDDEQTRVDLLLTYATSMIAGVVGKTDTWAATLDPIPSGLRILTIEAVVRVMLNPSGARSESETLGAYSHSASWETNGGGGLILTAMEERWARWAVYGSYSGSARVDSIVAETVRS